MKPGRKHDAAGIVALALAFHRSPVQHAGLLRGRVPLPPDVGILLKLAGGSAPTPQHTALARPDELRAAALFFIEQVLFHHEASHYRVLGLEPGAPAEQIKEHHRLLMRVFHPDRERNSGDWKDAFATRINLAYTSLHEPEARRRYDATLKPVVRPGIAHPPSHMVAGLDAKPAFLHSRILGLPPILLRYLPQWVLAATALLALLIVGSVYVNNPRVSAPPLTEPPGLVEPRPRGTLARIPVGEKAVATTEDPRPLAETAKLSRPSVLPPPLPATIPLGAPPREAPLHQPQTLAQNHDAVAPAHTEKQLPPVAPAAPKPTASPTRAKPTPVESAPSPAPLLEGPAPQAAQAAPRAAPVAAHPVHLDPNATLVQFMSSYERGDTQAFMALFDEVAIGRAGGKSQIRQEYESMVQSTDLRHIAIDNMAWAQEGNLMRGEGRYRTTLMRKGKLKLQTETGIIRIELLQHGDHALIMGLDYQPRERS